MPLNVQLANAQVKDPQSGQMIPAGLIGSDAISTINTAKNQAVAAVQQKGVETLESIPDDYTALSNEVDEVKTHLDGVSNIRFLPNYSKRFECDLENGEPTFESYTTPEAFGAVGDGVTDDSDAVQAAVDSDYTNIIFENEYLLHDVNIQSVKYLYFSENSKVKLLYYDASKQLFHNVFTTDHDVTVNGMNVEGEYLDTVVSQSIYTKPIILGNGCQVNIINSKFSNLKIKNRGSSPSSYEDRRGIVVTVINGGNLLVDNCEFDNLNDEEWIQSLTTAGSAYVGTFVIKNSHFKNGTGFSRICLAGKNVAIENNEFLNVKYKGSVANVFGENIRIDGNTITGDYQDVFDCSENGSFVSKIVSCVNNKATTAKQSENSVPNHLLYTSSCLVFAENNSLNGRIGIALCRYSAENARYGINTYNISIKNNTLTNLYGDSENYTTSTWPFVPVSIQGTEDIKPNCYIEDNIFELDKECKYVVQPIYINNANSVIINNNRIYGGRAMGTSQVVLCWIYANSINEFIAMMNIFEYENNDALNGMTFTLATVKRGENATGKQVIKNNYIFNSPISMTQPNNIIV